MDNERARHRDGHADNDALGQPDGSSYSLPPVVVGVGASAGGLEALRNLLRAVPEDEGLAFVIIQHLDPTHKSALTDLLSNETSLTVQEVEHDVRVEPNRVYVIPPNKYLSIHDCTLHLSVPAERRGSRKAIDYFLSSLAADQCESSIGIVLSGTGSDGTAGLREIKQAGGLTIAQAPEEAGQAGMPRSAIDSGVVDIVLPVSKIPERLARYLQHFHQHGQLVAHEDQLRNRDLLRPIIEYLHEHSKFDFRRYRRNTIARRVRRRMGLQQIGSLDEYLHLLRDNPTEASELARDLLIGVTSFFRDVEAWETLADKVLVPLYSTSDDSEHFRVWTPGCATGEEAYTIAILLHEVAEQTGSPRKPKIFATDIADDALDFARAGLYPLTIANDISPDRLRKFFTREDNGYCIQKSLRESVVFASQNVLSHPPFSRLDLVTCRNLLIYLEPDAQQRLMQVFSFALKEGSYLFLGGSEAVGDRSHFFAPVSRKWRIYRREPAETPPVVDFSQGPSAGREFAVDERGRSVRRIPNLSERVYNQLLQESETAVAVINAENRVVFLQGPVDDFLQLEKGELSPELPDIVQVCREGLSAKIRSLIHKARREKRAFLVAARVENNDYAQAIDCRISVRQLRGGTDEDKSLLLTFTPVKNDETLAQPREGSEPLGNQSAQELELELSTVREQLNLTVEDLETANEELKASNEEAMAMNEELQSNNEELETSKEELQSLNEELSTLNNQLELKVDQLQETSNDLRNLISSTRIGVVFLDTQFDVRLFTPAARELFHLIPGDIGRSIVDIAKRFSDNDLISDAESVLEDLQPREAHIHSDSGHTFIRRIVPYRSDMNRIEGVVLTFSDVSHLEEITNQLRHRERQQAALAELGQLALYGADLQQLMDRTCVLAAQSLQADFTKVLELLPERKSLLLRAGVGWPEGLVGQATVEAGLKSQAGYTLNAKTPIIVEDLSRESQFDGPPLLVEHGVVSGMSVIIQGQQAPWGVIGVHTREKRNFGAEDIHFLQSVANVLGDFIERQRVSSALSESESRFRMLADNMAQLAWTSDVLGQGAWYNKRWYEFTGTTKAEVQGDGWKQFQHPDYLERVEKRLAVAAERQEAWEDTFPLRGKDGQYRWFLSRAVPIRDDSGNVIRWFGTNTDITERIEAEDKLRASAELVRTIAENSTHALVMMNGQGYCTYFNQSLLDMTGYTADEIQSRPLHDLIHHHYPDGRPYPLSECPIDRALPEDNTIRAHEDVFFRKDGTSFPVMCAASPIFKDEKPISTVIEIRDVTDAKAAEAALHQADKRKDEFLATLAHELRNPLAPIRTGLDVLRATGADEEILNVLNRQVQQLIHLVDDLLDVSRITRGKLSLRKRLMQLSEVLEQAFDSCREYINDENREFIINVPESPIYLEADPHRITQVICNLLHNAVKYTPEKGRIELKAARQNEHVVITIRDNGIGIPPEDFEHIFEMFGQSENPSTLADRGLGIGLTLVKSLVELHDGRIAVTSQGRGRGAEFKVFLPAILEPLEERPASTDKEETPITKRSHRVLIVDDNIAAARLLTLAVKPLVAEARTAHDGLSALEMADEFRPHLILMDIGMPRMDGYETARQIRKKPWGADVVLVAVTGWGQEADKIKTREAGFDLHLTKPADFADVRNLIANLTDTDSADR